MKDWKTASDHIRRRCFDTILPTIEVEPPFEFLPGKTRSDTIDFLDANWETYENESNFLLTLPARDVNMTQDCFIALCKFLHVLQCSRVQLARGATTWSTVDAYHAAFLANRLICAFYGVMSYSIRGRTIVVDFRPELGTPEHVKAFLKENRYVDSPVRILKPKATLLIQRDAWALMERMCNLTPAKDSRSEEFKELKQKLGVGLGAIRNQVMYDTVFWKWREDFLDCPPISGKISTTSETLQALFDFIDISLKIVKDFFERLCLKLEFDFRRFAVFEVLGDSQNKE